MQLDFRAAVNNFFKKFRSIFSPVLLLKNVVKLKYYDI